MKRKMIALLMFVSMFSTGSVFAEGASGKTNVTLDNVPNGVMTEAVRLSASAAGTLTSYESGLALVTFQNFTPWRIRCFVNGNFVGEVFPGRALSVWTGSGWNRPYAQAMFIDGSSLSWDLGNVFYLPGGSYVFPMNP